MVVNAPAHLKREMQGINIPMPECQSVKADRHPQYGESMISAISKQARYQRLKRGWSVKEARNLPKRTFLWQRLIMQTGSTA